MFHYDFNDRFGLTGRYDYFSDKNGYRTGIKQKLNAVTFAPTFSFGDGLGGLFELRYDSSDTDTFIDSDGEPGKGRLTTAFELTFGF